MNPLQLQLWAQHVSDEYITRGVDPNASITKIAEDHDLNRIHIQRIVEAANTRTNERLRTTLADKTFTFPMADMDKIKTTLSGQTKVASATEVDINKVLSSYGKQKADTLVKEAASACEADEDKKKFNNKKTKAALKKIAAHVTNMRKIAEAELHADYRNLGNALDSFTNTCKRALFTGQIQLSDIEKIAHTISAEDTNIWSTIFEEVKSNLEKLGEPFTGMLATDKELLKDRDRGPQAAVPGMPVQVINGRNPLVKELMQISALMRGVSRRDVFYHEVDSLYSHIVKAERQFTDSAEVNDYIANEMAKVAMDMGNTPEELIEKVAVPLLGAAKLAKGGLKAAKGLGRAALSVPGVAAASGLGAVQSALDKARKATSLVPGLPPHRAVDGAQKVER